MKKLILLTLSLATVLAGSCTRESMTGGNGGKCPAKILHVSLSVQGIGTELATRATIAPETGEDRLSSLYLLFFAPDPYMGGQFIDYVQVNAPLTMNTDIPIDLSAHPLLGISSAYNVLAVANVTDNIYLGDNVNNWMAQWQGMTENQVMAQAKAWVQGSPSNDANAIAPDALLMNGRVVKAADQYNLKFTMMRNVSRFDVHNTVNYNYDLVSVSIWNAYPSSSIFGGGVMDYSNSAGRISRFYGVHNSNITGSDAKGDIYGNIVGGLYCFENHVTAPVQNDKLTTCLIVGMRDRTTGTTTFYRANIAPDHSPQVLKRNNVYRLTINAVNGPGQNSEELAYTGQGNNLDYVINYWDLDDNGLIVQDGNSILSIPTKTVRIGADGGTSSYSIFTFSSTPGMTLSIKSQTYDPANGGITASLTGNTLNINATPLGLGETQRTGVIVLSYAGLEASISVIQSPSVDTYLTVKLPDGGIPHFAPYAGISSGLITVKASGDWSAQLYMEGFSFSPALLPSPAVTIINSAAGSPTAGYITNNQFRIYTHSANPDPTLREAFIVVSLNSDPVNYASVIRIAQKPAGGIAISPNNQTTVTFNGMGTGLANIPGNLVSTFNVLPSMEDDGSGGQQISAWTWQLMPSGGADDTGQFTVTEQHDAIISANNTITVSAAGMNIAGYSYKAVLRLSLVNDASKYTDIQLVQQAASVDVSPNSFAAIPTNGGSTPLIAVQADASLQWSATITTTGGTATDGRQLVNHAATIADDAGDPIIPGTLYPMSKKFSVTFPKIYYPNRGISVSANVTVTVGGMTKTFSVTQNQLAINNTMIGYGMTGAPDYGGLGNTYNQGWDGTSGTYGLAQIPGYSRLGVGNMSVTTIASTVNYLHVVPHIAGAAGTGYDWAVINGFIDTRDAWTVISPQDVSGIGPVNNANSPTKRNGAGYTDMVYSISAAYAQVYPTSSKLYQFVMDKGHTPLTPGDINAAGFTNDGVNCTIPSPWPSTAVVLMTKIDNTSHASLIIDIKNKFMWIGDSQIFWDNANLSNNRGTFLDNLMYFIGNASKYGSNFTDMLRDDLSVPAPWDPVWGANAGVPSK